MLPRIIFLGTGGDSQVVGRYRNAGGIIVQSKEAQLHIDPGPGALIGAAAFGINLREHSGVLVSHNHLNHCNDINAVLSALSLNKLDIHGVLAASESVLSQKSMLTEYHKGCVEKIITALPGKKFGIQDCDITPTKAKHNDETTVGFKITTPNYALGYTSDTAYTADIAEQYEGCDIIILNVQHPFGVREKILGAGDAVRFLKRCNPKLAIITHFGMKLLSSNPLYVAREIKQQSGIQTIAADDGMTVDPLTYSAELQQKTLSFFVRQVTE